MKMLHRAVSKNEMKDITGTNVACMLCGHEEFLSVRAQVGSGTQITVIPNTASNLGIPNQMSALQLRLSNVI